MSTQSNLEQRIYQAEVYLRAAIAELEGTAVEQPREVFCLDCGKVTVWDNRYYCHDCLHKPVPKPESGLSETMVAACESWAEVEWTVDFFKDLSKAILAEVDRKLEARK